MNLPIPAVFFQLGGEALVLQNLSQDQSPPAFNIEGYHERRQQNNL